jgi:hypothetical protein
LNLVIGEPGVLRLPDKVDPSRFRDMVTLNWIADQVKARCRSYSFVPRSFTLMPKFMSMAVSVLM